MSLGRRWATLVVLATATVIGPAPERAQGQIATDRVSFTYYKLPNGLKVVLSQDRTAPIIAVGVYYQIGFRI